MIPFWLAEFRSLAAGTALFLSFGGAEVSFAAPVYAAVPIYAVPAGLFVSLEVVAHSSGAPTSVRERDKDGALRLFAVHDSTAVLRFSRPTAHNGNKVDYARDLSGRKSPQEILKLIGPMIGGAGFGAAVPATSLGSATVLAAGSAAFIAGYGIGELINQLFLGRPSSLKFIPDIRPKKSRICATPPEG